MEMEQTVKKKLKTVGPFSFPMGKVIGRPHNDFDDYNKFLHCEKQECCKWKVKGKTHLPTDTKTTLNIIGPFSKKDNATYYTCQKSSCEVRCLCSICDSSPCSDMLCKTGSFCRECNPQCYDHKVGVQRDFDLKVHSTSNKLKYPGIPLSCDRCKKDLQEHETEHSVIHQRCKFCLPVTVKIDGAMSLKVCRENERKHQSMENRTCKYCFKVFTRSDLRKKHEDLEICKKKNSLKVTSVGVTSTALELFKCDICILEFKGYSSLKRHQKIHQENFQLLKCVECPKTFMNQHNKNRHMTLVHNYVEYNKNPFFPIPRESRPFKCEYCEDTFKTKYDCSRHRETKHVRDTIFQCKFCSEQFLRKYSANRHSSSYCKMRPYEIVKLVIADLIDDIF